MKRAVFFVCFLGATLVHAATFHVSPGGNDVPEGGGAESPWRTIYYSLQRISPGDTLYLQPGATFVESVYIAPDMGGEPGAPITITSDPANRPVIHPPSTGGHAINVYNAAWLRFENLRVDWPGTEGNFYAGISLYKDNGSGGSLHFENVEISRFTANGLLIGSWAGAGKGYDGITIQNCRFRSNRNAGFFIYGDKKNSHANLIIRDSVAHDSSHGDGFLINGVTTGLVERCVAYNNGVNAGGRIGIWTYGVDGITIQYCESYNNRTNSTKDGGGFDFDGGTVNSVMQFNYSHGNDGSGFGVFQYAGAAAEYGPLENNIIRYNLSVNDGRRNSYGALGFWGANSTDYVGRHDVYHNTIYVGGTPTNGTPCAIRYEGSQMSNVRLRNNLIIVANGFRLINSDGALATMRALHQGNNWWAMPGTNFQLRFGATTYTNLADWRAATGNERLSGADVGTALDPRLVSPGSLVAADYALRHDSPLIDGALDLLAPAIGLTERGTEDFFGNSLPQGTNHDVGAHDRRPTVTLVATQATASEYTGAPTVFSVARTGATMKALTVPVTLGGTAQEGVDYPAFAGEITLPVGLAGVTLTLVPVRDSAAEGAETVSAALGDSLLFDAGTPSAAEATILDTPADGWRFASFGVLANDAGVAADAADPDGDGLPNLLEYALGLDPLQASAAGQPEPDAGGGLLSLRVTKNPAAVDVDWSAEVSATLAAASWTNDVTVVRDDAEVFEARDNTPVAGSGPRFMRLRVTREPSAL